MPSLNVANLLFSPTSLILIAASAALLISIGVLLAWPSGQNRGMWPRISQPAKP